MKPAHASQRLFVPEGFSGWWCERCLKAVTLPEELGSPARCPRCRKPTAVWVPEAAAVESSNELRVEYVRQRPRVERAKELFAHIQAVIETPGLNPDLREIEMEEYKQ